MINSKIIIGIITLLLLCNTSSALAGMPVTDPTSYTYYVEILKKDLEKIENQIENIEEVKKVYEESQKIYESMNGVYTKVKDYYDKYQKIRERIAGTISSAQDFVETYTDKAENMEAYLNDNGFIDVKKVMDDVFKDVRNPANSTNIFEEWPKRRAMIQMATKKAVVEAEEIAQALPGEMERLKELMDQIEQSKDIKESQDLSNHFLGEVLGVMQEQKALLAKYIAAEELRNYKGVDGQDAELVKSPKQDSGEIPKMIERGLEKGKSGIEFDQL